MSKIIRIIVEGPDCSGKSTLVNRIKNDLGWDSKSLHHKEGNQFLRYLKEYAFSEQIVFDRSHFSEEVYSILWRGGSPFSKEEKEILEDICKLNTLILFACPSLETMEKRYLSRDYYQQISFEELKECRNLFYEKLSAVPHLLYTSSTWEELNKISEIVREKLK